MNKIQTVKHIAAHFREMTPSNIMVPLLLKHGGNPCIRDLNGFTPLDCSLLFDNLEAAEKFLTEKDKLPNVTKVGRTKRYRHLVECLLRKAYYCNFLGTSYSALAHFIIHEKDEETFEYVLNNSKFDVNATFEVYTGSYLSKHSLLSTAVKRGTVRMITALMNIGADIHAVCTSDRKTPLIVAIEEQRTDIANLLLDCGVSLNKKQESQLEDNSPLHWAVSMQNVELVEKLLKMGADTEAKNESNRTSLDQACRFGELDIVELLLSHGAKINQGDVSTLHHAVKGENPAIVKLFLEKGVDVNYRCAPEKMLRECFNYVCPPLRTPLECALVFIEKDSICKEVIEFLIEYGVDVNVANPVSRETPLHLVYLSNRNQRDISHGMYLKSRQATIKLLLRHNANINALDGEGLVPLHYAIRTYTYLTFYWNGKISYYKPESQLVTLIAWIALLIEKKYCVIEENLVLLKDEHASPFYQKCVNELRLMKKNICESRNFSYFHILSNDIQNLISALKNEDFSQVLNTGEYKKNFPIYADYLEERIREATLLQPVVELAIVLFKTHLNKNILNELTLNIFKFFKLKDFRNLAKACYVDYRCSLIVNQDCKNG